MGKNLNKDYYLWESFKSGNDEAFYRLYDQHAEVLYHFGIHFSKDKDFIKDCIHDLFLDLYKYRKGLSSTDNIKFYLLRSLRRKIYKEQSKGIPIFYDEAILETKDYHVVAFEDILIASETEIENYQALKKAMGKLTDRQREILSLRIVHSIAYPEIAEMVGMSVESTRTNIYRALKRLRNSILKDNASRTLLLFLFGSLFKYLTC